MVATWTSEQVIALAPDPASAKNGMGLATLSKWRSLGKTSQVIWGECQGSGKDPYRTQVDLSEPAFKCSCPSRKFPCKHGIGLFLLLAEQPDTFQDSEPPEWVTDWLNSRAKREEKQKQKQEQAAQPADPAAQAKRTAERYRKVTAGVKELQLWLADLIRQGLATVQAKPYSYWEQAAARAVDAQAPGIARLIKDMAGIPYSGADWAERLLEQLSKLHLLLEGFQRLETLPSGVQADIRTQMGWSQSQAELLAEVEDGNGDSSRSRGSPPMPDLNLSVPPEKYNEKREDRKVERVVRDYWLVMGQSIEEEEKLRVSRSWLWGKQSDRPALILQFAYGTQPFELQIMPGTAFEAELAFYESAYPLRALIKTRYESVSSLDRMPGYQSIDDAIAAYHHALSCHIWLEKFPLTIAQVTLMPMESDNWSIRDRNGKILPIYVSSSNWSMHAVSGGHPITIFGEWNGRKFLPLSTYAFQKFHLF
ncbi:SWIM zinc finger family protein [Pseudanabaena sp. PCC 6802]|uniref:SWIM zinc finger family protein n=1 Tax=Pseudanabaena sp. PCC 6802 TaxID=118173 RepID=UPI00034B9B9C|nr:SWIM zinc finger family protein [Pseudanabaena sp. PCC 6802]